MRGQQQPKKRDPRSCCNESLEQRPPLMNWNADFASWWRQLRGWCCRRGTQVLCRWETGRRNTTAWRWFVPESEANGVHGVVVSRDRTIRHICFVQMPFSRNDNSWAVWLQPMFKFVLFFFVSKIFLPVFTFLVFSLSHFVSYAYVIMRDKEMHCYCALCRLRLSNIKVVIKTLGAGFHQQVDGLHHLTLVISCTTVN